MATPYDKYKKYLTKAQTNKLVSAQKQYSNVNADERVEALQQKQDSIDQQRRYLQNRGLASNRTNVISGLEPTFKAKQQYNFNTYNEGLKRNEDAQTANLAARYANQTIAARNAAAKKKAEEKELADAQLEAAHLAYAERREAEDTAERKNAMAKAAQRIANEATVVASKSPAMAQKVEQKLRTTNKMAYGALRENEERLEVAKAMDRRETTKAVEVGPARDPKLEKYRQEHGFYYMESGIDTLTERNTQMQAKFDENEAKMNAMPSDNLTDEQLKQKRILVDENKRIAAGIAENNLEIAKRRGQMEFVDWYYTNDSQYKTADAAEERITQLQSMIDEMYWNNQNGTAFIEADREQIDEWNLEIRNLERYVSVKESESVSAEEEKTAQGKGDTTAHLKYTGDREGYTFDDKSGSKYYAAVNDTEILLDYRKRADKVSTERGGGYQALGLDVVITEADKVAFKHRGDDAMYYAEYALEMTDEERDTFNRIYNEDGAEAADKYFELIFGRLDQRGADKISATAKQFVDELGPLGASIGSVLLNPMMSITGAYYSVDNALHGRDSITKKEAYTSNLVQGIRGEVSEDYNGVESFLYGTGMSMADSMLAAIISGGAGANVGGVMLGLSAYNSTLADAMDRGLDASHAQATAMAAGAAEMIFESLSLERLMKIRRAGTKGEWLKNTLMQAFTEGSEEVNTDLANAVTDYIINYRDSELLNQYYDLLEKGVSQKKAAAQVAGDFGKQLAGSFAGGFLSGGAMGGFQSFTGMFRMQNGMNDVQAAQIGKQLTPEQKDSIRKHDFGDKETNELAQDRKQSDAEMGRLYVEMQLQEQAKQYADAVRATDGGVEALKQFSFDDSQAQEIAKKAELTDEEIAYLYKQRLVEEVSEAQIKMGPDGTDTFQAFQSISEGRRITAEQAESIADNDTASKYFAEKYGGDLSPDGILATANIEAQKNASRYGVVDLGEGQSATPMRSVNDRVFRDASYVGKDYKNQKFSTKKGSVEVALKKGDTRFMSEMGKRVVNLARAIANITGVNIRIVDTFSDNKTSVWQTPNGRYDASTNTIEIALDSSHSVAYVVGHELTHWLKDNSPSAYATYQQVVMEEINKIDITDLSEFDTDTAEWIRDAREADPDVKLFDALVKYEMDQYNKSGVSEKEGNRADRAYAIDEVLAEVGETMLDNETVQREIAQKSTKDAGAIVRFLRRISENIKELLGKNDLTSRETELLRDGKADIDRIARAWAEMVKETKGRQSSLRSMYENTGKNGIQYDVRKAADGTRYVEVDPSLIDLNNGRSIAENIASILANRFHNIISANGQLFRINADTNGEWRESSDARKLRKNSPLAYNDKIQSIANADELIAAAREWIGEQPQAQHKDIVEFARGIIDYKVDGNGYEAEIVVGIKKDGSALLYDMTHINSKNIVDAPLSSSGNAITSSFATSTNNMINNTAGNVNPNSVRTREEIQHAVESKVNDISETTLSNIITGMTRKNMLAFKSVERVLDSVAGKNEELRNTLADLIEKPFNRAGGQFARAVKAKSIEVREKMKELKITKKSESRDIQRYGEGYYQTNASVGVSKTGEGMYHCTVDSVENGQSISREYDFTEKEIRKHFGTYGQEILDRMKEPTVATGEIVGFDTKVAPYTLDMLKEAHPDNWQACIDADEYFRGVYDWYVDTINTMLESVYPWVYEAGEEDLNKMNERAQHAQELVNDQAVLLKELRNRLIDAEKRLAGMSDKSSQAYVDEKANIRTLRSRVSQAEAKAIKLEAQQAVALAKAQNLKELMDSGEIARNKRLMKRNDYYHHFQEMTDKCGGLKAILKSNTEIDPALVGKTQETKPRTKWTGFLQKRLGGEYTEDAVNGMFKYITTAEYIIAFDPFIAEMRDLSKALRDRGHQMMTEARSMGAQEASKNAARPTLWLEDWTNSIAGKSNEIDRFVSDKIFGSRKYMAIANWLNSKVKSSKLLFNVRSAIVQISNITNAQTFIQSPKDWKNGVLAFMKMQHNEDMQAIFAQSNFMSQRLMESFTFGEETFKDKADNLAGWMLSAGDQLSSTLTWWAAYQQYARLGAEGIAKYGFRGYENAIDYADDVTRRTHGGRGVGEVPLILQSKTVNLFVPFQVEVLNTYANLKQQIGKKNALGIVRMEASIFVINAVTRAMFGDGVLGFDFIHALLTIIKTWADDDDDKDAKEKVLESGQAIAGEFISGVPFAAQLATMFFPDEETRQAVFGEEGDPTRYGTGTLGMSAVAEIADLALNVLQGKPVDAWNVVDVAANYVPGGTQIVRTAKGVSTVAKGYSESKSGRVQFAVDQKPGEYVQAALFGKWALPEAREYLGSLDPVSDAFYKEGGFKLLSEAKSSAYKQFVKQGGNGKDFFKIEAEMKSQTSDKDADGKTIDGSLNVKKLAVLDKYNLTDEHLETVWASDSSHATTVEKMQEFKKLGGSVDTFLHIATESQLVHGTDRKQKLGDMLDEKKLTDEQRAFVWNDVFGYKTEQKTEEKTKTVTVKEADPRAALVTAGYDTKTVDAWVKSGRSADEMLAIGSRSTSDIEAAELMRKDKYTEAQVKAALVDVRGEDPVKLDGYTAIGGKAIDYAEITAKAAKLDAKDENGKSVSGLKKKRTSELIKSYGVTDEQYDYLYHLFYK